MRVHIFPFIEGSVVLQVLPFHFRVLMLLIDREDHSLEAHIDYEIEFLFRIDQIDDGVAIVGGSFFAGVEGDGAGDVVQVYASCEKALNVLGWKTERDLANCMTTAWAWEKALAAKNSSSN